MLSDSSLGKFLNSVDIPHSFDLGTKDRADRFYKHEDLIGLDTEKGIDVAVLDWPTSDLVFGLVAEICRVPLDQIYAAMRGSVRILILNTFVNQVFFSISSRIGSKKILCRGKGEANS